MIKYALKCADGHEFESWFKDSAAFDTLHRAGQVACVVCATSKVEKTLMAPALSGPRKKAGAATEQTPESDAKQDTPLSVPSSPGEALLKQMREHLRKNSDYVGREFATEARRIHDGEANERSIWGEASLEDAKALNDDGIAVSPIPFLSRQDD